jgi:hypothetical protein
VAVIVEAGLVGEPASPNTSASAAKVLPIVPQPAWPWEKLNV